MSSDVRALIYFAVICCVSILELSCTSSSTAPVTASPGRGFRMGFSGFPPRFDLQSATSAILMWSQRADAAIISNEPPWDSLLAGVPAESLIVHNELGLANFYRSRGMALWLYVDPENGLNRGSDSDALKNHNRSITEPAIQQMFRRYVVVADSILRPDHLGVALETNLIRMAAPTLYPSIKQVAAAAATDVRVVDPSVKFSVSIQVDDAWGAFGGGYQGVSSDVLDFPFVQELGFSSYPYLAGFSSPDEIPADYYSRLAAEARLPVMVTEGGWTSTTLDSIVSSPDMQRKYIVKLVQLSGSCGATAVLQLLFTDIDLSAIPPPPGSILPWFAHLGLVDVNLNPKPALAAWDSVFNVPRL